MVGPRAVVPAPKGCGRGAIEDPGEERQQFLERGEPGTLARREMLHPTAESAPSGSPARAEVHDEGALYGEARSVFEAWWHAMVLLRPLTLRVRSPAI